MVDEGRFNDELFYRVASLPLHMPPLRDRKEDIPLLVKHFSTRATNPLVDTNLIEFTDDAMAVLTAYHWPGNLTEMSQLVSKIASTTETRVMTSRAAPLAAARARELADARRVHGGPGEAVHGPGAPRLPRRQGRGGQGAGRSTSSKLG